MIELASQPKSHYRQWPEGKSKMNNGARIEAAYIYREFIGRDIFPSPSLLAVIKRPIDADAAFARPPAGLIVCGDFAAILYYAAG